MQICISKAQEDVLSMPSLSAVPTTCSAWNLSKLHLFGFMEASLCKFDW
jgi:hypothetical protein